MRLADLQRIGLRGAILLTLLACAWVKDVSAQALTITTESLPDGVQGTPYSQPLTATGGTGTNTWTLESGSLPAGLALTTAGVINGTPTGTGPSNFTVQVTDGVETAQKSLTITVNGALTITTASLLDGVQGTPYSQTLTATGGTGTNTWTLASGSLPAGLALSTAGVISGTPTATGSTFTVQVSDGVQTAQKSLTITINGALTITTASLLDGVQGTPYSQTLTATGGTGSNSWSLASGSLPAGLSLSAAGVIGGTPSGAGSTFTVQVADGVQTAQKSLTITINAALTITTASLLDGVQGTPYSQTLTATGGTGSNSWSLASGSLPASLSLSAAGVIGGTPSGAGSTFTVQVADGVQTAQKSLTITINGALTITTASLPNGVQGTPYSQTLTASGGTGSNTWSLASGSLPAGLSLSAAGVIGGTPSGAGSTFTVQVADGVQTAQKSLTITINGALTITTASLPNGVQGTPYSQTLTASGGTGSNTSSLASGSLPAGLSLSTAGVISGTPSGAGSTFSVQVADGVQTAQKSLTITVNAVLTVTTASLPNGVQGTPYSQTLTSTGGTGTNTWSLATGTLPAGLAISSAGVISGTPTGTGASTFTVQVSDGAQTAQKSLTITVNAVLTITTASLPNGVQGTPYSQTLTATGGTGAKTWSLATGTLPAGLAISAAGVISGTPTGTGASTFTVQVTDGVQTKQQALTITVNAVLTVATASLPNGAPSIPYSQTLTATGGTGSNTWSLATGSLPTGLTLSAAGVISGTPSGTGTTFTVQVADGVQTAQKSLTITISAALVVATVSLPNGVQGTAYSQTLTATGGTGSNTWSLATGTLPAGLSLSAAGVISGTPTGTGLSTFTVQVSDGVQTAQKSLTITVNAVLTITTTSLPDAVQGIAYSQTLAATGGTGTNTWSLATGSLPTGLTLSAAGVISGTPTGTGASTFTVQVTDSIQTKQQSLTIAINAVLTITTASLPNGVQGTAYSQTLTATGGTGTKTWSLASGTLPVGLSLSAAGVISGTPTGTGGSTFTAQVTDGVQTAQKSLTITVNLVLTITTASLPNGVQGAPYSQTLTTTGGTGSNTWSVATGSLPTGLTLSAAGVISGTPTATGTASFTVQAADGVQTAQKPLTINVNAVLTITTSSLVTGIQGSTYSQTLAATGGTGSNTWSLATGSLPTGLTLSATGVISGTPTATGTTFTVRVTDGAQTAQKSLTLNVVAPLTITTASLPTGGVGAAYSLTLAATGGTNAYAWSIDTGSLPGGLNLNPATGVINGTPTSAGSSSLSIKATDNNVAGLSVSKSFTLNIVTAISVSNASPMPQGAPAIPYSQTLAATGGTGAYTWSLVSGTLPAGLTLAASGTISGTPTTSASSTFTVRATDATVAGLFGQQSLTLVIVTGITISNATVLANGVPQAAYSEIMLATGGSGSYTWSISSGSLPAGLTLSAAGTISGTPTTVGTSNVTIRATDSAIPLLFTTKSFTLAIVNSLTVTTSASLPGGVKSTFYSQILTAAGGTAPFTWSIVSGSLQAGLTLSSSGTISGSPTASGTSTFTVRVTDSGGPMQTVTKALTLIIVDPLVISTASTLPTGVKDAAYSQTLAATGGTAPYTWSIASGSLPSLLILNTSGAIGGIPTTVGTSNLTISITDSSVPSLTVQKIFTLDVVGALTITTPAPLPSSFAGFAYSQIVTVSGGKTPYSWSIATGTLPPGLTLNPTTGVLGGTPTTTGISNFTIRVTDSDSPPKSVQQATSLAVLTPPGSGSGPTISLNGLQVKVDPAQQIPISVKLSSPYAAAIQGTLTLTVTPVAGIPAEAYAAVQFSTGGRTVSFTVPANATDAVFPAQSSLLLVTGTVTGTLGFTGSIQNGPSNIPLTSTTVNSTSPAITALSATRVSGGLRVQVVGFSPERRVTEVQYGFDVRVNGAIQRIDMSRSIDSDSGVWYQNAASAPFGSAFKLDQLFGVVGSTAPIEAVTITLRNTQGSTTSSSVPFTGN